jgi:hypothetical protein
MRWKFTGRGLHKRVCHGTDTHAWPANVCEAPQAGAACRSCFEKKPYDKREVPRMDGGVCRGAPGLYIKTGLTLASAELQAQLPRIIWRCVCHAYCGPGSWQMAEAESSIQILLFLANFLQMHRVCFKQSLASF